MIDRYDPQAIEKKWQDRWAADKLYHVPDESPKPKWYALTMFPYTSGDLHIGHWYAMAPSDVYARYKRMQGFNVLHPMGFDAFGFPAENAAIKRGIHPHTWTEKNIENMRRQLKTMGCCYDWDREVVTSRPDYYKWTEWFFLKLYEAGLAYRAKAPVNWCPSCQAVLANEQVIGGGECWRCDTQVVRKDLVQWFFRITRYADELMQHDGLDWPERIKIMQRNWVGRSEGAEIDFKLEIPGVDEKKIRVFTTRPDTVYGVTFMVLAPEHPLVEKITSLAQKAAVEAYVDKARRLTEIDRLSTEREKDGVFTGTYVINQLNGEPVPVWIADYVIWSYGTGAVMAVPAHDERDFAFAQKYKLPVRVVISPPGYEGGPIEAAYIGEGLMRNSAQFNGKSNTEAFGGIIDWMESQNFGKRAISYKLRDWLISRQRYWGAPIPIIHCDRCGIVPVPEQDLPVLLPEDAEFKPTGESPLKYVESFVNTTCPKCGGPARRETDTMDTFMCSSWYFLRYCSPRDAAQAFDPEKTKYWMPVDIYTGGADHAVMHLFYSRFFTMALRDMGRLPFGEPFKRLFNQGVITSQHQKMSKSKGNVVNPDKYVGELGADTVRAYLMFVGPWELGGDWNDSGIGGMSRWFNRVWKLALEEYAPGGIDGAAEAELVRKTHQVIRKVNLDLDKLQFNTMLAALMEFTNYLAPVKESGKVSAEVWTRAVECLVLLLAPTAPHLAEELWQLMGNPYSVHNQSFPIWDEALTVEPEVTLVVQINGKVRARFQVPASITECQATDLALSNERVKEFIAGKAIRSVVYVPGKLINVVV
ncbi:leucine--tRNA ligase [Dehalogenimonas alkenigignens]|uniref:leucine--tRNA ligase n=1 Tax=Dehalogenimonas alkenigignens TaxID=1217799 RepID=UPI000D567373|nr:leucine--tRNA ligase [Dehalogenimonas alkenigignens]PVV83736.1 leucine--tRNA ligase [Dehalogenimonas alkenigignens]